MCLNRVIIFLIHTYILFNNIVHLRTESLEYPLLSKVKGSVGAENFTYYHIHYKGNILLHLISIKGDADIYISEQNVPTYEPATYDVHSATCGLDAVEIPSHWRRPFNVGIYGHISYDVSEFILEAFQLPQQQFHVLQMEQSATEEEAAPSHSLLQESTIVINENKPRNEKEYAASTVNNNKGKQKSPRISGGGGNVKTGVWALLEILEMLFL